MSILLLSSEINNMLLPLKTQTLDAILSILKERNHINIELHNPIHYAELCDAWSIHRGSFKVVRGLEKYVMVNFNNSQEPEYLHDLHIEQLIELLTAIENNNYDAAIIDAIELK